MVNCDISSKTFANKQNLYWHHRNIHNFERSKSEQRNGMECPFKSYSLAVMKKHVEEKQGSTKQKLWIYCNSHFSDTKIFNKHLQEVHSLPPVTQTQNSKGKLPQASAFGGTVQTYFLEANGDHDFLQFMVDRKQLIDEVIEELWLSARVKLEKPALEDKDAADITVHLNCKMETVYLGERLAEDAFFTMLDQISSSLFSFTSHGSGWMLKDVNGFHVKQVSYVPIRGSSYLALPNDLQSMNCLLNIKNRENNNCFLYCYVAAWHFAYAQSLYENVGWRMRTNPETYSISNPMTHQRVGDFELPMAFNQISRFENLEKVQVNVIRYQKTGLIPLRISKRQELPFILDLLLLSDSRAYHYVLIKNLKVLISNLKQQVLRSSSKICRNCFHVCYTAEIYERHFETCMQNEAAAIKLPDETKNDPQFQNNQSRWFAPYVMSFEFESLIRPVATRSNTSGRSSSETIERHEPCGFCLVVIKHNNPEPVFFKLERSSN